MNIYEQQAANRRMTAVIMGVFVAFFLVLGLGFDFFYLNFNPGGKAAVKWNSDGGYYEAQGASRAAPAMANRDVYLDSAGVVRFRDDQREVAVHKNIGIRLKRGWMRTHWGSPHQVGDER